MLSHSLMLAYTTRTIAPAASPLFHETSRYFARVRGQGSPLDRDRLLHGALTANGSPTDGGVVMIVILGKVHAIASTSTVG